MKHWFLFALAGCFLGGYQCADTIRPVMDWPYFRSGIVFTVMAAMGVTLKTNAIRQSLARPTAAAIAITGNTLVVPLLALPTYWVLPPPLFGGLFLTSLVPCTLASASVWTRKAGGDDSIALLTTVVTNLGCVVVVPIGLLLVLSQSTEVSISQQVGKLVCVVVMPLILSQWLRRVRMAGVSIADWADRHKAGFSRIGQIGILSMVVMGAAESSLTMSAAQASSAATLSSLALLLASVVTIHLTAMGLAIGVARWCCVSRSGQIACGIAGSQKTLMVGLQIAMDCGVSVVPMLVYHLSQLLIDTVIAERWNHRTLNGAKGNLSECRKKQHDE